MKKTDGAGRAWCGILALSLNACGSGGLSQVREQTLTPTNSISSLCIASFFWEYCNPLIVF